MLLEQKLSPSFTKLYKLTVLSSSPPGKCMLNVLILFSLIVVGVKERLFFIAETFSP